MVLVGWCEKGYDCNDGYDGSVLRGMRVLFMVRGVAHSTIIPKSV